ncbi:MAG: translation elongation factor 4 [Bacillota bacterium]
MPNDRPVPQDHLRNFCIIAHIDHGKSTLADRILEVTGAIAAREMQDQVLDQMDLERERGITIKATAVNLAYHARDGQAYVLNLIDTPGHVDFSYEVSRSLAACEGALLVVDATQGIEAQTLANAYLAMEHDLVLVPVINKIDLPSADVERVKGQIKDVLGLDPAEALAVSAKAGRGIDEVLEAVVKRIPPPAGGREAPLQALIFDSHYDSYKGAISYVRVFNGSVRKGLRMKMMSTGKDFEVSEVGVFRPAMTQVDELPTGHVGYIAAGVKNVADTRVGDTITTADRPAAAPLPGYRKATPMVYCGLYPVEPTDYEPLREALEKLQLNDAALVYEPETSAALGFGFRGGFLGLLHMEIVQERLEREYGLDLVTTAPNVVYRVIMTDGTVRMIDNPVDMPTPDRLVEIQEPYVKAGLITPTDYLGPLMDLCRERRGVFVTMEYIDTARVELTYELPLGEIMFDFFDQLKSRSRGYASLDYDFLAYRSGDLVRMDLLINEEPVDALSVILHRDKTLVRARALTEKLKEVIPRHLFEIPVQAAIGRTIIARETVKAMRKDVLAKCYGGDVTRKRKLLEKQKEGKKRMKRVGQVDLPQEAFMAVLKIE